MPQTGSFFSASAVGIEGRGHSDQIARLRPKAKRGSKRDPRSLSERPRLPIGARPKSGRPRSNTGSSRSLLLIVGLLLLPGFFERSLDAGAQRTSISFAP